MKISEVECINNEARVDRGSTGTWSFVYICQILGIILNTLKIVLAIGYEILS